MASHRDVRNPCGELFPDDKLRDDIDWELGRSADFVNWNDIGMFQFRNRSGFFEVELSIFRSLDELGFGHFDSDFAL